MLERAVELQEPLDNIACTSKDLKSWALTNLEWKQINDIMKLLKVR
jgi:hypothetical protein